MSTNNVTDLVRMVLANLFRTRPPVRSMPPVAPQSMLTPPSSRRRWMGHRR